MKGGSDVTNNRWDRKHENLRGPVSPSYTSLHGEARVYANKAILYHTIMLVCLSGERRSLCLCGEGVRSHNRAAQQQKLLFLPAEQFPFSSAIVYGLRFFSFGEGREGGVRVVRHVVRTERERSASCGGNVLHRRLQRKIHTRTHTHRSE